MISKWLARSRIWLPCGRHGWTMSILTKPTSFLDHAYLGCTQRWMQTKCNDHWGIYTDVWITYICRSNWKVTRVGQVSRKDGGVVLWYGRTCSKVCWTTRKWSRKKKFKSLLGWSSIQTGKTWINCQKLLTNCIEMIVLGTNRKTRHSVVGQQTCKSSRKMDGMWQTFGMILFMHSSHKWLPTILSCG